MGMYQENVLNLIKSKPEYESFLRRERKWLDVCIDGVQILFIAEEKGVGAYLRYPYVLGDEHKKLMTFLQYAIPELSERVEEQRLKDLYSK